MSEASPRTRRSRVHPENIAKTGYLRARREEIMASVVTRRRKSTHRDQGRAVAHPIGVGARDLRECLLLQSASSKSTRRSREIITALTGTSSCRESSSPSPRPSHRHETIEGIVSIIRLSIPAEEYSQYERSTSSPMCTYTRHGDETDRDEETACTSAHQQRLPEHAQLEGLEFGGERSIKSRISQLAVWVIKSGSTPEHDLQSGE